MNSMPGIPADFSIPGYYELTQHLPKEEREAIDKDLSQVDSSKTAEIQYQYESNQIPCNILTTIAKSTMLVALKAFKENLINIEQLASLHILDGAVRDLLTHLSNNYQTRVVWDGKVINKCGYTKIDRDLSSVDGCIERHRYDAVIALDESHATNFEEIKKKPQLKDFFALDDNEWLRFCNRMETKCKSEKYCHIINVPTYGCWSIGYSNLNKLVKPFQTLEILFPLSKGAASLDCIIVPSFSMLQAFVDTRAETFQRESFRLQPIFGKIDHKDVARMKYNGVLPLHLYWPESDPAKQYNWNNPSFKRIADDGFGSSEGPFSHIFHDMFEALREVETPKNIREACSYLANLADNYGKINNKDCGDLSKWLNSSQLIINPKSRLLKDSEERTAAYANAKFGDVFYIRPIFRRLDDDLKKYFIKDMAIHQEVWKKEFNLDREDLKPNDQIIYDSFLKV